MSAKHTRADFEVRSQGNLYLVLPTTKVAAEHLEEHVGDGALWWGKSLVVEHRYVGPLIEQLNHEGYTTNV